MKDISIKNQAQPLVYFPQMWSMNTNAMKRRLITRTGTGPLKEKETFLIKLHTENAETGQSVRRMKI